MKLKQEVKTMQVCMMSMIVVVANNYSFCALTLMVG